MTDGLVVLSASAQPLLCPKVWRSGPPHLLLSRCEQLSGQIHCRIPIETAVRLPGRTADGLAQGLGLLLDQAERVSGCSPAPAAWPWNWKDSSRGHVVVTRTDDQYPKRLRDTLKHQARRSCLAQAISNSFQRGGIAVIGSRQHRRSRHGLRPGSRPQGRRRSPAGWSRAARAATDRLAMGAALDAGGIAFGVLADSLDRTVRQPDLRQLLLDGQLVFIDALPAYGGLLRRRGHGSQQTDLWRWRFRRRRQQ